MTVAGEVRHMDRNMSKIDILVERIQLRLAALGKSERAVSIEATNSPDAIRYIRARRAMPSAERLSKLAIALDASPQYLLGEEDNPHAHGAELEKKSPTMFHQEFMQQVKGATTYLERALEQPGVVEEEWDRHLAEDVPVIIAVPNEARNLTGIDGAEASSFSFSIHPRAFAEFLTRKWEPCGYGDEYGILIVVDSIAPAYEKGDLVIVRPHALVMDYCVIYLNVRETVHGRLSFDAIVGRLVGFSRDQLMLEQFSPAQILTVPRESISRIDHISSLSELIGRDKRERVPIQG
jgi:transcriptional regulator with XRE-family HTH domain